MSILLFHNVHDLHQLKTFREIKKQRVHYRILRSYKDTLHGPSDRIRTCGILLPKQARYQLRYTRIQEVLYTRIPKKASRKLEWRRYFFVAF